MNIHRGGGGAALKGDSSLIFSCGNTRTGHGSVRLRFGRGTVWEVPALISGRFLGGKGSSLFLRIVLKQGYGSSFCLQFWRFFFLFQWLFAQTTSIDCRWKLLNVVLTWVYWNSLLLHCARTSLLGVFILFPMDFKGSFREQILVFLLLFCPNATKRRRSLEKSPLRRTSFLEDRFGSRLLVNQLLRSAYPHLSAPSPGDDLRSKSAIRLRGQTVRSDSFWGIGCDFSAVTIRLRLRYILRWKMAKSATHCGNSLRCRLRFKKSLAIAVAMPWCTQILT